MEMLRSFSDFCAPANTVPEAKQAAKETVENYPDYGIIKKMLELCDST